MSKNIFEEISGSGTYATYARAEKRAEEASKACGEEFRYLIAATKEGRFFPIITLRRDEQRYAGILAHSGICAVF